MTTSFTPRRNTSWTQVYGITCLSQMPEALTSWYLLITLSRSISTSMPLSRYGMVKIWWISETTIIEAESVFTYGHTLCKLRNLKEWNKISFEDLPVFLQIENACDLVNVHYCLPWSSSHPLYVTQHCTIWNRRGSFFQQHSIGWQQEGQNWTTVSSLQSEKCLMKE